MNKRQQQIGFGLLELLIAIVVVISLSATGIMVAQHYSSQYSQAKKIGSTLQILHEALNNYYLNHHNHSQHVSLQLLSQLGYINDENVFNIDDPASPFTNNKLYEYTLMLEPNEISITISTDSGAELRGLSPDIFHRKKKIISGRTYYYRYYEWDYRPLRQIYNNRQSLRAFPVQRGLQ